MQNQIIQEMEAGQANKGMQGQTGKIQSWLEWKLARNMKGNRRWVCGFINSIRKKMEKVNLLLGQAGDLLRDKEKTEVLSAFFLPSVFIDKFCFQFFQVSINIKFCGVTTYSISGSKRDLLDKLDRHNSQDETGYLCDC